MPNCKWCLSGTGPRQQDSKEFAWLSTRSIVLWLFLSEHFFSNISSWGAQDLFYCLNYSSISYRNHKQGSAFMQCFVAGNINQYLPLFRSDYAISSSKEMYFLKLITSLWPTVDLYFLKAWAIVAHCAFYCWPIHFVFGNYGSMFSVHLHFLFNIQGKVIFSIQKKKKIELSVN